MGTWPLDPRRFSTKLSSHSTSLISFWSTLAVICSATWTAPDHVAGAGPLPCIHQSPMRCFSSMQMEPPRFVLWKNLEIGMSLCQQQQACRRLLRPCLGLSSVASHHALYRECNETVGLSLRSLTALYERANLSTPPSFPANLWRRPGTEPRFSSASTCRRSAISSFPSSFMRSPSTLPSIITRWVDETKLQHHPSDQRRYIHLQQG